MPARSRARVGDRDGAEAHLRRAIKLMSPDRRPIEALKALLRSGAEGYSSGRKLGIPGAAPGLQGPAPREVSHREVEDPEPERAEDAERGFVRLGRRPSFEKVGQRAADEPAVPGLLLGEMDRRGRRRT